MRMDEIEGLADAGQHAQRQHIHLHDFQRVEIVLVPFDEIAVLHRGGADRHDAVQHVRGQDKAADMLGEMAGKADQLRRRNAPRVRPASLAGSQLALAHLVSSSSSP